MSNDALRDALTSALAHHNAGRLDAAEGIYRQILNAHPNHPDALHLLGVIAIQVNRPEVAIDLIGRAIAINANNADYHAHFGQALARFGQSEKAIGHFERAIQLRPDFAEAYNNFGNALRDLGQTQLAIEAYRNGLRLKPDFAQCFANLGNALRDLGDLDNATEACRRAIELKPYLAAAHNALGNVYKDAGLLEEAIHSYRRAMEADPRDPVPHNSLIYALHFHPDYDMKAIRREQDRWWALHGSEVAKNVRPYQNGPDPHRRLRIGYVSPNFFIQAECFFVLPLLESHDRAQFEVHCYSDSQRVDSVTKRMMQCTDGWHSVAGMPDERLAEQIRADGIDILIDLTMHMHGSRLTLFARKPAPVQVTWLAYPGTTGVPTIGYRITDRYIDPPDDDVSWSSELPLRMPDSWCCYDPVIESPEVNELPASNGGVVTFGSLNNACKIGDSVLNLWSQILTGTPNSRLNLLSPAGQHRQRVTDYFMQQKIEPARIDFAPIASRMDYLRQYHRIDIALDPIPYNGITTTCDALWMGVPVVTMAGGTAASRVGAGLLNAAGLSEWCAKTDVHYVKLATDRASDPTQLAKIRGTLRSRIQGSPLMQAGQFAKSMELRLREIWHEWCQKHRSG